MIRVLIADDSTLTRTVLRDLLAQDPDIRVIAEASDGRTAVDLVTRLRPDLVIMDVMMPIMDGLEAISEIMAECPTPILVLSANTDPQNSRNAFSAIRLGALDVMEKPGGVVTAAFDEIAGQLISRVKSLCRIRVIHHFRRTPRSTKVPALPATQARQLSILAIGASTGGPPAILHLLRELPKQLGATILIVQHIAEGFASGFAAWLHRETGHRVRLAENSFSLVPEQILIAPNGSHMTIVKRKIRLSTAAPRNNCRPAVDCLFQSLAEDGLAPETAGLLLTGMGQDGAAGLLSLKHNGAVTLAQDQASSAIFGMPKAAIERGAVDRVLALDEIPAAIKALFERQQDPFPP